MPLRGSRTRPSRLGCIVKRETLENKFYRVQVSLTLRGVKKTAYGPLHRSRALAQRDLEGARTASTHEEMWQLLAALQECSKQRAAVKENCGREMVAGEQRVVEEVDQSSEAVFSLSDRKEEMGQWSLSGVPAYGSVAAGVSEEACSDVEFARRLDEIGTWVADHMGRLPKQTSVDAMERTLAYRYDYLKRRRDGKSRAGGGCRARAYIEPKFRPSESAYFDRLEDVLHRYKSLCAEHFPPIGAGRSGQDVRRASAD